MTSPHLTMCLRNPAFHEEEGVTIENGKVIAFVNSDGIGRMLHVTACEELPNHSGLHVVIATEPNGKCAVCKERYDQFHNDNDSFRAWVATKKI